MPSATLLTSAGSVTPGTSFVTASVSPTANRWMIVDVWTRDDGGGLTAAPTVTGLSLSYTTEATRLYGGTPASHMLSRHYAWTGASPGSGAVTLNNGAITCEASIWSVYELSSDTDTGDPFVQTVTAEQAGGTSISVTLAAFTSVDNRPLIVAAHRANEGSTPEAGYTEVSDVTTAGPVEGMAVAYHLSSTDTTPSYSWATSGSDPQIAIASEIRAAAAAGASTLDPFGMSGFFGA